MWTLLYFKPTALLRSRKEKLHVLSLLHKLTEEASLALACFLRQEYQSFDAQVGDTSCQIRAYKVCLLANDDSFRDSVTSLIKEINLYHRKLKHQLDDFSEKSSHRNSYEKELDKKQSLLDFLNENDLLIEIEGNTKFLILSHFLTKYCATDAEGVPQAIDYNLIKKKFLTGSTPARLIANHYQALLSKLSCEFIIGSLNDCSSKDGNQYFLKKLRRRGDRDREMLPYYNEMKVLLHSEKSKSIPIIFSIDLHHQEKIKKLKFVFVYKKSVGTFRLQLDPSLINASKPAVIFKGEAFLNEEKKIDDYLRMLLSYSPLNLILYNAAAHPQYAGQIETNLKSNPYTDLYCAIDQNDPIRLSLQQMDYELKAQQLKASLIGCSKQSPQLFFIKHIYSTLIKNELCDATFFHPHFSISKFNSILARQDQLHAA